MALADVSRQIEFMSWISRRARACAAAVAKLIVAGRSEIMVARQILGSSTARELRYKVALDHPPRRELLRKGLTFSLENLRSYYRFRPIASRLRLIRPESCPRGLNRRPPPPPPPLPSPHSSGGEGWKSRLHSVERVALSLEAKGSPPRLASPRLASPCAGQEVELRERPPEANAETQK